MPAKTKKDPVTVQLYLDYDFLEAYARHTDRRIALTGYKAAVGADEENWDSHGELQLAFLKSQGLRPEHRLLELGCGTGRLARKAVRYLDVGQYTGVDISHGAIERAVQLSLEEGWRARNPWFVCGEIPTDVGPFDVVWSFSVMIHVPQDVMAALLERAARVMHEDSILLFSYVDDAKRERTGVKQFRKTLDDHKQAAAAAGLSFNEIKDWIRVAGFKETRATGHQRVARCLRLR
jgi:cyclopropane fatty-acyl-phospholipid synthase-like methyltransferase